MPELKLKRIEKTYGRDTHILKGIDLDIADGEFLVLVGPSGCGKSTLLRCIAGLEDISSGELQIDGKTVNALPPKDRDVAMVFQSYALYPHMTVRENMGFSLNLRKHPKIDMDRMVEEAAQWLGLSSLLERFPKELSGGQRQRVAIGRAIVRKPKVFLFDEPLSNLDANLRAQMRVELKKLHQKLGVTMIYVTHDQIEAMTLADRICVLEGGHARQVDTPRNLYERPNSVFVAGFIGSPPMNFLPVSKKGQNLIGPGVSLPLSIPLPEQTPENLLLGIRPHEFLLQGGRGTFAMEVEVVETVGWDLHLHGRIENTPLVVQMEAESASQVRPGSRLQLGCDPEKVKLFEAQSGCALRLERG